MRFTKFVVLAAMAAALAVGCGGDLAKQIAGNAQLREQVMTAIAGNKDVAMEAVDKFMADEGLRTQVFDRILANKDMAAGLVQKLATNQDLVDQVVGAAVKDPAMKDHLVTLLKGMSMAEASAAPASTPATP